MNKAPPVNVHAEGSRALLFKGLRPSRLRDPLLEAPAQIPPIPIFI